MGLCVPTMLITDVLHGGIETRRLRMKYIVRMKYISFEVVVAAVAAAVLIAASTLTTLG